MSKEKRRVPKLRFPGFTEDWEQRKLGDYLSIPEREVLEVKSANDLLTVKLNLGGVELGANRDTLSLGSTVYYKRYAGQFIYGKQNFFNGSMGIISQNLDGKGSSGDVPSFNILNIETNYLYTYVSRESYWRPKVAAASGTGSKRIHEKTLLDFNIDVPSINEQKLISNTFDLINRFITLNQRKLDNLKLKKKALLQKLFPKNGERYPELRFPGFTDAWEQRKLGDVIASLYNGQTPSRFDKANWEGDIPWLTSGELNRGVVNHSIEKITQQGRDDANLKIVPKGTVVIAITGLEAAGTRGNCAKLGFDTTLNQSCMAIYPKSEFLDPDFLFQWYIAVGEEYGIKYTQGTKQQSYNAELIKILPISVPRVTEQRKITRILDLFDDIITLHQRKLDHLQLQKKALLQQMFV